MIEFRNWSHGNALLACRFPHRWRCVVAIGRADAVEMNALMGAVPTRGVAELAANTFFLVNARYDFVVQVEMFPFLHPTEAEPPKIGNSCEIFLAHPVGKTVGHVFHNAIAVVHNRGANLHRSAAEQNKFRRIAPVGDTTDTGKRQACIRIRLHLLNHIERDRLDGRPAVSAVRGLTVHVGPRNERVEIDSRDGVDGVDRGESVGAAALCCARNGANVR